MRAPGQAGWITLVFGCLAVPGVLAGGDNLDSLANEDEQYAISVRGCAFVDGYRCGSLIQRDFLDAESQNSMISGNFLEAWRIAVEDFQSQPDQTSEQTRLKHYKIGFSENADHYIVLFQGLLLPIVEQGSIVGVSRSTLGRTTRYWISKDSFEIDRKMFYK